MTPQDRPPHSPWRRLYPFASHSLDVKGWRMHYVDESPESVSQASGQMADSAGDAGDAGDAGESNLQAEGDGAGRPAFEGTLLFVHGNPTWSFHWRRLIEALRGRFRCVAPDHLGCGLSEKPPQRFRLADRIDHLERFVDRLDLDRVTLVAQDWGGAIGLGTLIRRRERFERIVLFNTGAFPPPYIPWQLILCGSTYSGKLALQGANFFSRAAVQMAVRRKELPPEVVQGYLAPYDSWANRRAVHQFVQDIPKTFQDETWQRLSDIESHLGELAEMPSLLIWGMQDWCFREECLDRFTFYWPRAEVHRLEDVGHWVVEDAPEESLSLVEGFLARTAPALAQVGAR